MTMGQSMLAGFPKAPNMLSKRRSSFSDVTKRLEQRVGKLSLSGRYHKEPQLVEEEYELSGKHLGSGYTGSVYLATRRGFPEQQYAVKVLNLSNVEPTKLEQLKSEVENHLSIDHPNISRLHDVYESRHKMHLVMEFMEGGELFQRVVGAQTKCFTEPEASEAVWQILLALNYLHSHGIVHRDLKLENVVYDKLGSNHLELIDFGFSKMWDPSVMMEGKLGTIAYVAPEVLMHGYTSQCDLWSLGVITFILLAGYMPFVGEDEAMMRKIIEGKYIMKQVKWKNISSEAVNFTTSLLDVDPQRRLTAQDALQHQWIANRRQVGSETVDTEIVEALRQFRTLPKFRRCCMELIAWSLSNEQRKKVSEHFISMGTSRRGIITLSELKKAMETLNVSDEEVLQTFAVLDTNHDDEIHYSDFLAAMVSTKIELGEEMLCTAFRKFDMDSSGFITAKDLQKVVGDTFEGEQVEALLRDASPSGACGRISYPEFAAYLIGTPLAQPVVKKQPNKVMDQLPAPVRSAIKGFYSALVCAGPGPK
mmetsp:Transcript_6794/g.18783  ORF Transcript_6794/g.18783 Transcript_6794/m.18783 type:complete len:535 (-) Transcript_6794:75-1679(-)|eukprot:CAMPEP_0179201962 /NCGR_PEP_ID=MMETSP0796-20121207/100546_1 /TAXON_ID=73915 /ORGANISM="Pyrodinium bahamense, Strain pbaha01" /LENGTH=534 /DNA_ID=CAMNT_0020906581 /DNA_START=59 /DNA_END=1663 /DNA_ORIENTATION=-